MKELDNVKMWESLIRISKEGDNLIGDREIGLALKDQGFKWDGKHIVPIEPEPNADFKMEAGKWYVCTQSMMNNDIGKYEFVKNKIYYSPDGVSLRSDFGWLCSFVENADIVLKCFRPATNEEIFRNTAKAKKGEDGIIIPSSDSNNDSELTEFEQELARFCWRGINTKELFDDAKKFLRDKYARAVLNAARKQIASEISVFNLVDEADLCESNQVYFYKKGAEDVINKIKEG